MTTKMRAKQGRAKPVRKGSRGARPMEGKPEAPPESELAPWGLLMGAFLSVLGILWLKAGSHAAGMATLVSGVGIFLAAAARLKHPRFTWKTPSMPRPSQAQAALLALSVLLSVVSVAKVARRGGSADSDLAVASWIGSLLCLIAAVIWVDRSRPSLRTKLEWQQENTRERLLLSAVMTVAIVARVALLDQHPYPWSGDEASVGIQAVLALDDLIPDVFDSGWSGNPLPAFYMTGALETVLGQSFQTVRLASALTGILAVFFLYKLAKELFDRRIALIAAAFLSTFPFHLQFSRLGVMTIQDTLVVSLTLWLVLRAVRLGALSAFLWAGLATGFTFYTYVGGRLVLGLAFATLLFSALRIPGFLRSHGRALGVYALATVLTLAPMAAFFVMHSPDFFARYFEVAIIPSGWLAEELTLPGKTLAGVLINQFSRTTLVFVAQKASGSFFNYPQPYLTIAGSLCFLLGLGLAIQRWRRPSSQILLTWFLLVVLIGGVFTINPPANTRMVMTTPALALFVAMGISELMDIIGRFRVASVVPALFGTAVTLGLVVHGASYYFGPYRVGHYFNDANSEVAMHAAMRLKALGPHHTLIMLGEPRLLSDFPTIRFVAPENPRLDVKADAAASANLAGSLPAFMVAVPENRAALQAIARRYPGGEWETVAGEIPQEVLYFSYTVPSSMQEAAP